MDIKLFKAPPSMFGDKCSFCENSIDKDGILAAENVPGGRALLFCGECVLKYGTATEDNQKPNFEKKSFQRNTGSPSGHKI